METMYVTFRVDSTPFCKAVGISTRYYAVECRGEENAKAVAIDLNSIDGVDNVRINKSGRIPKKREIIPFGENYIKRI